MLEAMVLPTISRDLTRYFRHFLRELHSVLGDIWGERVTMNPQLRHDLQWWTNRVHEQANGKNNHRPVEITSVYCGNSEYN
jgi:hypothetical protein